MKLFYQDFTHMYLLHVPITLGLLKNRPFKQRDCFRSLKPSHYKEYTPGGYYNCNPIYVEARDHYSHTVLTHSVSVLIESPPQGLILNYNPQPS